MVLDQTLPLASNDAEIGRLHARRLLFLLRLRQLQLGRFPPLAEPNECSGVLDHEGTLNGVLAEQVFEVRFQAVVGAPTVRDALHQNRGALRPRQLHQPPLPSNHEILLREEDDAQRRQDNEPHDEGVHPEEYVAVVDVPQAPLGEIVIARTVPAGKAMKRSEDKRQGHADHGEYPHCHHAELHEHAMVKTSALYDLIRCEAPGRGSPRKKSLGGFYWRQALNRIVLVDNGESSP
mmetsp:Transcript_61374/g.171602  ORF Transcript_61374/g.171602 Transcript_61374/m.171602 type:complete len:235 (-) Transcript_61374:433-1137(-)